MHTVQCTSIMDPGNFEFLRVNQVHCLYCFKIYSCFNDIFIVFFRVLILFKIRLVSVQAVNCVLTTIFVYNSCSKKKKWPYT